MLFLVTKCGTQYQQNLNWWTTHNIILTDCIWDLLRYFQAGYITIDNTRYFIEPVDEHQANSHGHHLHVLYKAGSENESVKRHACGTKGNWEESWKDRFREQLMKKHSDAIKPRGATSEHRYLETAVVVDKKFIQYHKSRDIETYILTVMNMVSRKLYLFRL